MLNKVQLIGNLGNNPVIKTLESGTTIASFSIATTRKYKDKSGEVQSRTEWHNVVAWGKLAEIIERFVYKGSKIYIEGEIRYRSYEKDGAARYMTEIVANNMLMLDGKKATKEPTGDKETSVFPPEDDLPY
jgi:single-strand DNA-binding protein